jgi:hypothetical protein
MNPPKPLIASLHLLSALSLAVVFSAQAAVVLSFDSAVPGTIQEVNGLGIGFTHRLLGSGASIPANDPNMSLTSHPGRLAMFSSSSDLQDGRNLGGLQAPGVLLPNVKGNAITISALFRNVNVPNSSDHLMVYAGASSGKVLKAGVHEQNVYLFSQFQGAGDQNTALSGVNAFNAGEDIRLTLTKTNGLWTLSWQNLTRPSASGSGPGIAVPWLDDETDLYVGVMALNPGSGISFLAEIDSFSAVDYPAMSIEVASVAVKWQTRVGENYQLQFSTELTPETWTNLGSSVSGNGQTATVVDSILGEPKRFYRLIVTP